MKNSKFKTPRVRSAIIAICRTKTGRYWWPLPFDKKGKFIPSSVDCLYNQEYFEEHEAVNMMRSL
jgi:hypothetical protein